MTKLSLPITIHAKLFIDQEEIDDLLEAGYGEHMDEIETQADAIQELVWQADAKLFKSDDPVKHYETTFDISLLQ